mgnify:FL=1
MDGAFQSEADRLQRGSVALDITGGVFGRLVVIERRGSVVSPNGKKKPLWLCRCECGTEVTIRGENLRSGHTNSCGCRKREASRIRPSGENSPNWASDAIGYKAAHLRVKALRGVASNHACVDCGGRAGDWSYTNDCPRERISQMGLAYSPDPTRYVARCRSCHKRYDIEQAAA